MVLARPSWAATVYHLELARMSVKLQELVKVLYLCQLGVDKANVFYDSDDYRLPATGGSSLWVRRTRDLVALPFQAGHCREKFKEPTDKVTYHDILPY